MLTGHKARIKMLWPLRFSRGSELRTVIQSAQSLRKPVAER